MTTVLSSAYWEISIVSLSVLMLSAVSLAAMTIFLKGTGMLRSRNHRDPPEEGETPENKEL